MMAARPRPEGVFFRTANGTALYSHVVTVEGGRLVFVSGQVARDEHGQTVGKGDMRAQIDKAAENIGRCLKAAGASMADIIKITTYVTDIDEYFKHTDARIRHFGQSAPASSTVEVKRLSNPDFLIEIEAVAATE